MIEATSPLISPLLRLRMPAPFDDRIFDRKPALGESLPLITSAGSNARSLLASDLILHGRTVCPKAIR